MSLDCKQAWCSKCEKLVDYSRVYLELDPNNWKEYCAECGSDDLDCCMVAVEKKLGSGRDSKVMGLFTRILLSESDDELQQIANDLATEENGLAILQELKEKVKKW